MLAGPPSTVAKARKLRRQMSWPEVMIWQRLRQRPAGFKFRRQHPAGPYILDFFCSEAKLAIEIDGSGHDFRADRDLARCQWLKQHDIETIRISAADVTRDPDGVVDSIIAVCARIGPLHRSSSGPPPRSGEETSG
jgi:very-short-patch-repair endonuclease